MHVYLSVYRFIKYFLYPDMGLRLLHNCNYFHTSSPFKIKFLVKGLEETIHLGFVFMAKAVITWERVQVLYKKEWISTFRIKRIWVVFYICSIPSYLLMKKLKSREFNSPGHHTFYYFLFYHLMMFHRANRRGSRTPTS